MKSSPAKRKTTTTPRTIAKLIAKLASDKKAEDILVLDMRKVVTFCDYFVLCSGTSERQVKAISDGIAEGLNEHAVHLSFQKGVKENSWTIFDMGDVVTHIFLKDTREFYRLEYLWQEAKKVQWK